MFGVFVLGWRCGQNDCNVLRLGPAWTHPALKSGLSELQGNLETTGFRAFHLNLQPQRLELLQAHGAPLCSQIGHYKSSIGGAVTDTMLTPGYTRSGLLIHAAAAGPGEPDALTHFLFKMIIVLKCSHPSITGPDCTFCLDPPIASFFPASCALQSGTSGSVQRLQASEV